MQGNNVSFMIKSATRNCYIIKMRILPQFSLILLNFNYYLFNFCSIAVVLKSKLKIKDVSSNVIEWNKQAVS